MKRKYMLSIIGLSLFIFVACGSTEESILDPTNSEVEAEEEEEVVDLDTTPTEIELTDYSEEVGFDMEAPSSEVQTSFSFTGSVEEADQLQEDYVWIILRKTESIEEVPNREIEYFIPLEDGTFNEELNLPNGAGQYRMTVRVPATDRDNYFYDVATFKIENVDETIARDIELTQYGRERDLQFNESVKGFNTATESFELEGKVNENYKALSVLVEVKKDSEVSMLALPVEDGSFKGDLPLYFGEGTHEITLKLYTDDDQDKDGTFYDSASFYVQNDSNKVLPEMKQYGPYIDRGLMLEDPSWKTDIELDDIEYPIKGTINPDAPLADTVSHVIVEIQHSNSHKEKATYFFPVEDNEFEGTAHFRFGSGDYEVNVHVPEEEQKDKSKLYYIPALQMKHTVKNIEDKRDILPSRGVDSDDLTIIEQAEKITDGITDERKQAKAIYQFVAEHVSYDVKKFKDDIFHPDDTATATLESGTGICQDYTFLTLALLRSIDIESRYVQGYAGGRHAWVEAKVDGEWIEMDPTWGAGYVDGDDFHFKYNEDYFDPDPDFLDETHTRLDLMY